MKTQPRIPVRAALAAFAALYFASSAGAIERITLANGFDLLCDHHALVQGRIRVYPHAAAENYFELKPTEVTLVETLPDPPSAPKAEIQQPAPVPTRVPEAKLTPADLHQILSKASTEHNVDADLLASVVKAESGGQVRAVSHAGARGLMQLMPGTARQLGVNDSFAPEQNVRGGATYLDSLLTRYHDNIALALAAYNAGPEAVDHYRGIPPYRETRAYVAVVIHEFNRRVAARQKLAKLNFPTTLATNATATH